MRQRLVTAALIAATYGVALLILAAWFRVLP